jgi:2-keto-4-pentenoate hydratase
MNDSETNAAAATLMEEHARGVACRSLTSQFHIRDIEDAYAVQRSSKSRRTVFNRPWRSSSAA